MTIFCFGVRFQLPKGKPLFAVFFFCPVVGFRGEYPHGAGTLSGADAMGNGDDWLDFKEIKARLDARAVLSHLGLLEHLEERGAEWVGWCPFGDEHGKKDSFAVNIEKKTFQCFACKARGSILDLVAQLRNCNLRGAAQLVLSVMDGGAVGEEKRGGRPYGKAKPVGEDQNADVPAVMPFALASRLILQKKLDPSHWLVVNVGAFGFERVKEGKE